jgi:hypothetical protein
MLFLALFCENSNNFNSFILCDAFGENSADGLAENCDDNNVALGKKLGEELEEKFNEEGEESMIMPELENETMVTILFVFFFGKKAQTHRPPAGPLPNPTEKVFTSSTLIITSNNFRSPQNNLLHITSFTFPP